MDDSVSKLCSDFLRECYPGLKASHARELVAAFFGYKSHAALLAEKIYPAEDLSDAANAAILIPDVYMIDQRRDCLNGLPKTLAASGELAYELAEFMKSEFLFTGEVWHCYDVGEFLIDEYLPEHLSPDLDIELADVIASTNAFFEDAEYDTAQVDESRHSVNITVLGTYSGTNFDDKVFSGDTIDMEISVELPRWAGRTVFSEPEIDVSGTVNSDYADTADTEQEEVTA